MFHGFGNKHPDLSLSHILSGISCLPYTVLRILEFPLWLSSHAPNPQPHFAPLLPQHFSLIFSVSVPLQNRPLHNSPQQSLNSVYPPNVLTHHSLETSPDPYQSKCALHPVASEREFSFLRENFPVSLHIFQSAL